MHSSVALATFLVAQIASPSPAPATAAPLPIHIAVDASALKGLPRQTVSLTAEDGKPAKYEGVALRDVLTKAGLPAGHAIRGDAMRDVVVVGATDGYRVAFGLAELDPDFSDHIVLIADTQDGAPLSAREGPYQLIVPGDKHAQRWVRNVNAVDIERIP
jgi:hypothetical protein